MLGHMIAYIRKEKKLTKAGVAQGTNINTGHLTHIEKGERNPSHKVLKNLCKTMGIPYRPLMYTYDSRRTPFLLLFPPNCWPPPKKIARI